MPKPPSAPARRQNLLVGLAAAPTALILLFGLHGPIATLLTLSATVVVMFVANDLRIGGRVPAVFWGAVGVLTALALARGPLYSHDLWSYAFDGRMLSLYRVDPYHSVPAQFPSDVLQSVVRWKTTPAVYGPLFISYAAVVTRLAGNSLLFMRLWFQGLTAAAVIGALFVLHRARLTSVVILVGLAPFVWVSLVNGGHNDALVAVSVLAAALSFRSGRWFFTGAAIAVAAMIKLPALLVAIPLVLILAGRRQFRQAVTLLFAPAMALLFSLVFLPASLSNSAAATKGRVSRASIWRPLKFLFSGQVRLFSLATVLLVLFGVVLLAWRRRHDADAALALGSAASVFGLLSSYTLIWYQIWGLPTLALSGDTIATTIVFLRGSLMQAAYQLPLHGPLTAEALSFVLSWVVPPLLALAFMRQILRREPFSGPSLPGATAPVELVDATR